MEEDGPETWNEDEPGENVGWTAVRGVEQGAGILYLGGMVTENGRSQAKDTSGSECTYFEGVTAHRNTRFHKIAIKAKYPDGQWTKETIGLLRVQQLNFHLIVAHPFVIFVSFVY